MIAKQLCIHMIQCSQNWSGGAEEKGRERKVGEQQQWAQDLVQCSQHCLRPSI